MSEEFIVHGRIQTSNYGGWEVMLSDCGTAARVRDNYNQSKEKLIDSGWLEIEYMEDEEGENISFVKFNDRIIELDKVVLI